MDYRLYRLFQNGLSVIPIKPIIRYPISDINNRYPIPSLTVEERSGECVAAATAKVEIRRRTFAVSPQVNGVRSCSEGGRPPVTEAARV